MSHILFAWELGEDLGHLARIAVVAKELVARRHKVTVAVKDLSRASLFFSGSDIQLMQSPVWLPRPRKPPLTKTMADILAYRGYGTVDGLTSLIQAWSSLLEVTAPDVVVTDYAPTALLAASRFRIPRVIFSNSFSFPQPGMPAQDICPWVPAPLNVMRQKEQQIVDNINTTAARLDFQPVHHFSDVFKHEAAFITELPLFDSYRHSRKDAHYLGTAPNGDNFETADWGATPGKRIFVYLKPGRPHVDTVLRLLKDSEAIVRGYFPGDLPPDLKPETGGRFQLSNQPLNVGKSLIEADGAVFHGGIGTLCQVVLAGKPALTLPTQIEQTFNSYRIREVGNGDWIGRKSDNPEIQQRFQNFMTSDTMAQRARALAEENAEFGDVPFVETVCDGIEGVVRH
ncbi:glycosyltransferase [Marinobacter salarius]|jgi:UDP:flavonoid glycosyltransferase YjiC (YdhE family)|uniref:glycosyltransferase n=1 Tax=Marinobacter salarius TaxID=1420917 RepID=UPI003BABA1E0